MFTIAVGNAFDGIELRGMFDNAEDANEHADREFEDMEWNVVEVKP